MPDSIEIIYYDERVVVAVKPAGTVSEDVSGGFPEILRSLLGDKIYTVHRLDRATAGLMVYARDAEAAAVLSRQMAAGELEKRYLALLPFAPAEKEGELRDLLFYDRKRGKTFVVDRMRKGVREAVLQYRVLSDKREGCLVLVRLITGRTHQIRAQFAARGLPLCGDPRYGGSRGEQLGLFCCELSFILPSTGERKSFRKAPVEGAFASFGDIYSLF